MINTVRNTVRNTIRQTVRLGAYVKPSYPDIIEDGNTVAWYDAFDLSTITKDGSNIVTRVNDKLGSGRDLVSGSCLWSAVNGLTFNGIDQYLRASAFTLIQPEFIYLVVDLVANGINFTSLFDGNSVSTGRVWKTGGGTLIASAGIASTSLIIPHGGFLLLKVLFNGASSKFKYSDINEVTGDFGAANMGGFILGARPTSNFANINVKEVIIRKVSDTSQNEADISAYLKTKYTLT